MIFLFKMLPATENWPKKEEEKKFPVAMHLSIQNRKFQDK